MQLKQLSLPALQVELGLHSLCAVTDQNTPKPHSIKYPNWQREFEAALREGDPQTLRQRVDAAEAALFLRSQALVGSAEGQAELQAISDAMRALRAIQQEKLGYPDLE
jgi:hypothetical protein